MFPTEQLNLLWLDCSQDKSFLATFKECLQKLFRSENYQWWLHHESQTPFELTNDQIEQSKILEERQLLDQNRLLIKINQIGDKIFITDGAWVSHVLRVFPDPDESLLLLELVDKRKLAEWADWVIDPAAGCGHTPIGFSGHAKRVSCDANARALLFARVNAKLNGLQNDQFFPTLNDMKDGFPPLLAIDGKVLFLANVPFAPAPRRGSLALNSAGGSTGADLQIASFQMVHNFQVQYQLPVRACFVTWTVGSLKENLWEVPEICKQIFSNGKVRWEIIQHDYDAPEIPNPAPIHEMLSYLARSQYAVTPSEEKVAHDYKLLTTQLREQGHTHIAYGILEVDLD